MKRVFLITIVLLGLMACATQAQVPKPVTFGFKGGISISKVSGDLTDGMSSRMGFTGGFYVSMNVSPNISIQPEAIYSMKGAEEEGYIDLIDETMKAEANFDYVEIPVLIKVTVPTQSGIATSFYAGPAVAFKTSAKFTLSVGDESATVDIDNAKSTDFGLVFGGGVQFPFGASSIGIEARYSMGLGEFLESADEAFTEDAINLINADGSPYNWKHGVFSLMVSYNI